MGDTQGSIIIASEGMYVMTCIDDTKKIIIKKEQKVFDFLTEKFHDIQDLAIKKYRNKINIKNYYKKIIQDKSFIKMFNKYLKKINIVIKYYPRKYIKKQWILDNIYIKVKSIE